MNVCEKIKKLKSIISNERLPEMSRSIAEKELRRITPKSKPLNKQKSSTKKPLQKKGNKKVSCPPMRNGVRLIDKKSIETLKKCIAAEPQTKELYYKNGQYTPERQAFHNKIIKAFKANVPCIVKKKPIAILTGGAPGSGKSYFLKSHADWVNGDNVLKIDADEVRAKLPEYKGWNASATHLESKDIVERLLNEVGFPCKTDIVYDGTMNKAKNYEPLIKQFKKAGYKIYIIYIQVPKETSVNRVLDRYKRKGRYVPMHVIDEVYERGLNAYEKLIKKADGYIRVDGLTQKIIEKGGEPIPSDRNYFQIAKDLNEKVGPPKNEKLRVEKIIETIFSDKKDKKLSELQLIELAKELHKIRKKGAKQRDANKTHSKRLAVTHNNILRWITNPGGYDLIGVDCFEGANPTIIAREVKKAKVMNVFGL